MNTKNELVEVVIDNKVYKLSGVENERYIRTLAGYVDKKIKEITDSAIGIAKSSSAFFILAALNIADDYYKEKDSAKNRIKKAEAAFSDEIKSLKNEKEVLEGRLAEAENEIERLSGFSDREELLRENEIYKREYENLSAQIKEVKLELNKAKSQLGSAKFELEKHKNKKNNTNDEKDELITALEALKNENEMLKNGFNKLMKDKESNKDFVKISELEAEISRLSEEAKTFKQKAENNRALFENAKAEAEQAKKELTEYIETFDVDLSNG